MKKLCLVLMLIPSMLFGMSAYAEEIDISVLSVMELLELRDQIAARLNQILGAPDFCYDNIIVEGIYICGENIRPGTYLFECTDEDIWFQFHVYKTSDTRSANLIDSYLLHYGEKASVALTEGMCLKVLKGYALVKPWSPFWAQ